MAMQNVLVKRALGRSGLEFSAIGLGCMSSSGVCGASDDGAEIAAAVPLEAVAGTRHSEVQMKGVYL